MKRQASITVLRGVKTSLFLLAVIGVSTFLSLSSSRPVQAESLLYTLRCTVTGLLGDSCTPVTESPTTNPKPTPGEGNTNPGTTKPGSGGGAGNTSNAPGQGSQPVEAPEPIKLGAGLLEEMPGVASAQPVSQGYTYPAHIAPVEYPGNDVAILGEATTAPLEASEGGWRILGVSWVWWLSILAALTALVWGIVVVLRRRQEAAQTV
jgi:hypothetical protein